MSNPSFRESPKPSWEESEPDELVLSNAEVEHLRHVFKLRGKEGSVERQALYLARMLAASISYSIAGAITQEAAEGFLRYVAEAATDFTDEADIELLNEGPEWWYLYTYVDVNVVRDVADEALEFLGEGKFAAALLPLFNVGKALGWLEQDARNEGRGRAGNIRSREAQLDALKGAEARWPPGEKEARYAKYRQEVHKLMAQNPEMKLDAVCKRVAEIFGDVAPRTIRRAWGSRFDDVP